MTKRLRITIRGAVQGVGFRPFVFRLATEMGLAGWVSNSSQGVFVEVEGTQSELERFLLRVEREKPPRASVQGLEYSFLDPVGLRDFVIRHSDSSGEKTALVLPDIATCLDCVREVFDPTNRRYLYPFTNCTNCGPRFSIIEAVPYDRANTTMKCFVMCDECRHEYEDPLDRRFHAQPNACLKCGPHLELWDQAGREVARQHEALLTAVDAIRAGSIVAVKGLGGFHLLADARNDEAVKRLRRRKRREEKPLALMFPALAQICEQCEVSDLERRVLFSPESPIVLLRRQSAISNLKSAISPSVAPGNPYLGIILPYTPLHHLLMGELGFPVVATSGNLSDEPICTDELEAVARLRGIADLFLVHNRPIIRHVDDSVVRVILGREQVLRRARGYAPLPIQLKDPMSPLLAVGGHLKNTVAVTAGANVFISQHIGDLETSEAFAAFQKVIASLQNLYNVEPEQIVCDMHPDYLSTKYAGGLDHPTTAVQHHYAHVAACMAENELDGRALGVAWDGTGYGLDGTIWGGEFLLIDESSFQRVASFRQFKLPGSASAIKEPRRSAIGLLFEVFGNELFEQSDVLSLNSFTLPERKVLRRMLTNGLNSPLTSSVGRLFDAVASLVGLRQRARFEGQAAMELEFALDRISTDETYEFRISEGDQSAIQCQAKPVWRTQSAITLDWSPMVRAVLADVERGLPVGEISAKFHNSLVEAIVAVARRIGEARIVLTGGCFQNKYLTERAVRRLEAEGFRPYWHQRVPPNDGGIALGQVYAVVRMKRQHRLTDSLIEIC